MSKRKKTYIIGITLLIFFSSCKEPPPPKEKVVKVVVATPQKRNFQKKISLRGNVEPREFAQVCAKADASIENLYVKEGDFVKEGDILFCLEKIDWESKVKIEEYNLHLAQRFVKEQEVLMNIGQAKLAKSEIDLRRSRALRNQNLTSSDELESLELSWKITHREALLSEAKLESSQAKVAQAQNNLTIAKKYLQDCSVTAPFSGTITKRYKERGEYARKSEPILRLENHEELELSFLLSAQYYHEVHPQKTKAIIYQGDKKEFTQITYKSSYIDMNSRTFEVKITLPQQSLFISGMMCKVDLVLEEKQGFGVPQEAVLLRQNNRHIIFLSQNQICQELEVFPGIRDEGYLELKNLVHPETLQVIVQGQSYLNEGTKISTPSTPSISQTELEQKENL